jgi:hypothetical protein
MLRTKKVSLAVLLAVVLCSSAFAQTHPVREHTGMPVRALHQDAISIGPAETLKATYSVSDGQAFVSCGTSGCLATSVPIYSTDITCPGVAGKTCTYDIQISGQVFSTGETIEDGENGLYQFLVDSQIPNGGGTDASGFYSWQFLGPAFTFSTSYNLHSKVTNSVANQKHNIAVNLSCEDDIGANGCFAEAVFQTLVVRVLTP